MAFDLGSYLSEKYSPQQQGEQQQQPSEGGQFDVNSYLSQKYPQQGTQQPENPGGVLGFMQDVNHNLAPTTTQQAVGSDGNSSPLSIAGDAVSNFLKGIGKAVVNVGGAATLGVAGAADKAYNAVTGTATPTEGFLGQANKFATDLPGNVVSTVQGEIQGAKNLMDPSKRQDQLGVIGENTFQDPFQALLNATVAGDAVGVGVKAAGKAGENAAEKAAIKAAGLSPEEAATVSLATSPLSATQQLLQRLGLPTTVSDLGSQISSGANMANPVNSGINAAAKADTAIGNVASRTAAKIGGGVSGTGPEALIQRMSDPAAVARASATADPYELVNKVNQAVQAAKDARGAAYEEGQQKFLSSIPQDHPYYGITERSAQETYQPQVLDTLGKILDENNVGIAAHSPEDLAFAQDYATKLLNGNPEKGVLTGSAPWGPEATARDIADYNRFHEIADRIGIKAPVRAGSGVGFTDKARFGMNSGDQGLAQQVLQELNSPLPPTLSFTNSPFNATEESTISKAARMVSQHTDWSPQGVNMLRQKIGKLYRAGDYTNQANPVIQKLKSAISEPLQQFPEYRAMNDRYAADSQALDQMRQAVGDGQTQTPQQQIAKIARALGSNNPITQDVVDQLEKISGGGIKSQMAGYATSSKVPNRSLAPTEALAAIIHPAAWPAIAAMTGVSIPAVQGAIFGAIGRASRTLSKVTVPATKALKSGSSVSALLDSIGKAPSR